MFNPETGQELFSITGWFIGSLLTPAGMYSSSAKIRMSNGFVMPAQGLAASQQTHVAAMSSPNFIASMAAKTGVPAATITANWRVDPIPGSQLIRGCYTCPSAKEASTMANAMVTAYCSQAGVTVFDYARMPTLRASHNGIASLGAMAGIFPGIIVAFSWRRRRQRAESSKPWFAASE